MALRDRRLCGHDRRDRRPAWPQPGRAAPCRSPRRRARPAGQEPRHMKPKTQRLTLALLALAAIVAAALLALSGLRDQAAYFYTPSDAARAHLQPGAAVRLGGMVEKGSLKHLPDGVSITFAVTDNAASVPVRF